jgi:hypothetical protein
MALSSELALKELTELSYDRLRDDYFDVDDNDDVEIVHVSYSL